MDTQKTQLHAALELATQPGWYHPGALKTYCLRFTDTDWPALREWIAALGDLAEANLQPNLLYKAEKSNDPLEQYVGRPVGKRDNDKPYLTVKAGSDLAALIDRAQQRETQAEVIQMRDQLRDEAQIVDADFTVSEVPKFLQAGFDPAHAVPARNFTLREAIEHLITKCEWMPSHARAQLFMLHQHDAWIQGKPIDAMEASLESVVTGAYENSPAPRHTRIAWQKLERIVDETLTPLLPEAAHDPDSQAALVTLEYLSGKAVEHIMANHHPLQR